MRYDVGLFMEEIAIDLMGHLPESENGNREAKTIAEKLVMEFISCFGVPVQIKSDRSKQFDCELFRTLCELLDVEHKLSTAFHPQGNSRVEHLVKVLGNLIAVFSQTYREWDRNLPLLTSLSQACP